MNKAKSELYEKDKKNETFDFECAVDEFAL